jgi:hypothetical protein
MSAIDKLEEIWNTYQVTKDCLKVTERSINKKPHHLKILRSTDFISDTSHEANQKIKLSRDNADDYVILALWTVFERKLFEEVQIESRKNFDDNEFAKRLQEECENKVEYWKFDEILDIYKSLIDTQLIGTAKNIKKYRDWVVHKNPNKQQPDNITPTLAYNTLYEMLERLENYRNQF